MLPSRPLKYNDWAQSGSITFAESRGNENLVCASDLAIKGIQQADQGILWGLNERETLRNRYWNRYNLEIKIII